MTKKDCAFFIQGDRDCPSLCHIHEVLPKPYYADLADTFEFDCDNCMAYISGKDALDKLTMEAIERIKGESK